MLGIPWLALILATQCAHAFDPLSALAVANGIGGALDSIVGGAAEISGAASAFTDLYSELETDASVSDDARRILEEIQDIESTAREAGYTAEDIMSLTNRSSSAVQGASEAIERITKAVKAAKRARNLYLKLDARAKQATIQSADLQAEQLKVMWRLIRQNDEKNLTPGREEIRKVRDTKKYISGLETTYLKRGAKYISPSGVLSFPISTNMVEKSIEIALRLRPLLLSLVLVVFLSRLIFYQLSLKSSYSVFDLCRDTIVCFALMNFFPELVRGIVQVTAQLPEALITTPLSVGAPIQLADLLPSNGIPPTWFFSIASTMATIKWLIYSAACFITDFGTAFMVVIIPLIIFASQMLNFAIAWPAYLGILVSLCLWPLFWKLLGALATLLWTSHTSSADLASSLQAIFVTALQLTSPLIFKKVISGAHPFETMRHASQAITSAFTHLTPALAPAAHTPPASRGASAASWGATASAGPEPAAASEASSAGPASSPASRQSGRGASVQDQPEEPPTDDFVDKAMRAEFERRKSDFNPRKDLNQ